MNKDDPNQAFEPEAYNVLQDYVDDLLFDDAVGQEPPAQQPTLPPSLAQQEQDEIAVPESLPAAQLTERGLKLVASNLDGRAGAAQASPSVRNPQSGQNASAERQRTPGSRTAAAKPSVPGSAGQGAVAKPPITPQGSPQRAAAQASAASATQQAERGRELSGSDNAGLKKLSEDWFARPRITVEEPEPSADAAETAQPEARGPLTVDKKPPAVDKEPADEKPADEKPADEKPADEKPQNELATDERAGARSRQDAVEPGPEAWAENGRPLWAASAFECLLFRVAGLTLAVPLVELGAIHPIEDKITPVFGQADWFMGLLQTHTGNFKVAETAKIVMPERYRDDFRDNVRYLLSLNDSQWGLAIDAIDRAITLQPEEVRWRSQRSQRPWLAGTVVEHMCALLDVSTLLHYFVKNQINTKS